MGQMRELFEQDIKDLRDEMKHPDSDPAGVRRRIRKLAMAVEAERIIDEVLPMMAAGVRPQLGKMDRLCAISNHLGPKGLASDIRDDCCRGGRIPARPSVNAIILNVENHATLIRKTISKVLSAYGKIPRQKRAPPCDRV